MVQKCIAVQYGRTSIRESWIFEGGSKDVRVPILLMFYFLETENKKILVDAGCDTMRGFVLKDFIGPVAALQKHGIAPEEITDVILTHAHGDHAQGGIHFPRATVHVQELELEKAKQYLAPNADVRTFSDFCRVGDVTAVKIGGHSKGSCVVEFTMGGKTHILCGDECYTRYNLIHKVPTATTCDPAASAAFVQKYANGDYICHLCHDK